MKNLPCLFNLKIRCAVLVFSLALMSVVTYAQDSTTDRVELCLTDINLTDYLASVITGEPSPVGEILEAKEKQRVLEILEENADLSAKEQYDILIEQCAQGALFTSYF